MMFMFGGGGSFFRDRPARKVDDNVLRRVAGYVISKSRAGTVFVVQFRKRSRTAPRCPDFPGRE